MGRAYISLERHEQHLPDDPPERWYVIESETIEIDVQDPPAEDRAALQEIFEKRLFRRHYGGGGESATPASDMTDLQLFLGKYPRSLYAPYALLELSMAGARSVDALERLRVEHPHFAYSDLVLYELVVRSLHMSKYLGSLEYIGGHAPTGATPAAPTSNELTAAREYSRELESRFPDSWYAGAAKRRIEEALERERKR